MLRMYECNWCGLMQVKDGGSVTLKPAGGGRMALTWQGTCYKCVKSRRPNGNIMHPMIKNSLGDWNRRKYKNIRKKENERMRVVPQLTWH